MAAALTKRFTPVRIQAVQTSLFHKRKQREKESVDGYAQALRVLFQKAYPSAQRGSLEAEDMRKTVLASQFASRLLPDIKVKVAGSEVDFDTLLAKDQFEETKLCDPATSLSKHRKFPLDTTTTYGEGSQDTPIPACWTEFHNAVFWVWCIGALP